MKHVRKAVRALALTALMSLMFATVAFAAENGSVWLSEITTADGVSALIVTDTTVTDGLVKLTYDSSVLTYQDIEVAEEYVAMYSVNPDQEGIVLVSWVAPEAYATDGSGIELISVNFTGKAETGSIVLSGTVHDEQGNEIVIGSVDTTELEEKIAEAEELNKDDYTEESYKNLEEALAAAEAVLADPTATQSEVDAAKDALQAAIEALVKKQSGSGSGSGSESGSGSGSTTTPGTTPSDPEGGADTGDNTTMVLPIVLAVISVAAVAVMVILKNRRHAK